MADDQRLPVLADARDEARRVLRIRAFDSFMGALKFAAGTFAVCGGILTVLKGLDKLNAEAVILVLVLWVATFGVAWVTNEMRRHMDRSQALIDLLAAEKYYEVLLSEVRTERDDLRVERDGLAQEQRVLLLTRGLVDNAITARNNGDPNA